MGVLAIFDDQGRWGDTHVCDAVIAQQLAPLGATWVPSSSAPVAEAASEEGVRLVYLRVDTGHLGVLCEPGERIDATPGASESPALHAAPQIPPGLPSLDEFVETMLALTGHASDDEDEA